MLAKFIRKVRLIVIPVRVGNIGEGRTAAGKGIERRPEAQDALVPLRCRAVDLAKTGLGFTSPADALAEPRACRGNRRGRRTRCIDSLRELQGMAAYNLLQIRGNPRQRCERIANYQMRAARRKDEPEHSRAAGWCDNDFRCEPKAGNAYGREALWVGSISRLMGLVELNDNLDGTVGKHAFPASHEHAVEIPYAADGAMEFASYRRRPTRVDPRS